MDSGSPGKDGEARFGTGGWVQSLFDLFALAGCAHWPSAAAIDLMAAIQARRTGIDAVPAAERDGPHE